MTLAANGMFRAKWTLEIHDEWIRNLVKNRPDLDRLKLERQRNLMVRAIPDSLVENYQHRISSLSLPDPDDRHVLAAAIQSKSQYILTKNLKDFPLHILERFGIKAIAPGGN